jgi:Tfp pilus assembly protein PilF
LIRQPENSHAHFVLGSHLFHRKNQPEQARPHLQKAVTLHPRFLRAWACLGALYESIGDRSIASKCYEKAEALENNDSLKDFFRAKIASLKSLEIS